MSQTSGGKKNPIEKMLDGFAEKFKSTIKTEFNNILTGIENDFIELQKSAGGISKELGRGAQFAFGLRQSFADALPDVRRLGGEISDITSIQEGVISATGRGIQFAGDEFAKLFSVTKILGDTNSKYLFETFKKIGVSAHNVGEETEKIIQTSSKLGLNVEQVYEKISSNIDYINKINFRDGVEGLTRMAAKATALKIDMGQTFAFADKIMNPEGAIEMANAFQRLGAGTSALLDPLRLMDLSMNDPEQLQNELLKMTEQFTKFNSETGRFEITNKRMFQELAKELGMSYNELTKMALGGSELNRKLSEIKFPEFMTKEQQEMVANMSEMKGGEYVIRVMEGGEMKEKRISEIDPKNIEELLKAPKTAEEIQKQSLDINTSMAADVAAIRSKITGGVARSRTGEALTQGFTNLSRSLYDVIDKRISPKKVGMGIDQFSDMLSKLVRTGDVSGTLLPFIQKMQATMGETSSTKDLFKEFLTKFESSDLMKSQAFSAENKELLNSVRKLFKDKLGIDDGLFYGGKFYEPNNDAFLVIKDALMRNLIPEKMEEKKELDASQVNQNDKVTVNKVADQNNIVPDNISNTVNTNQTTYNYQSSNTIKEILKEPIPMKYEPPRIAEPIRNMQAITANNMMNQSEVHHKMEPVTIHFKLDMNVSDPKLITHITEALEMNKSGFAESIKNAVGRVASNYGNTGTINKGLPTITA